MSTSEWRINYSKAMKPIILASDYIDIRNCTIPQQTGRVFRNYSHKPLPLTNRVINTTTVGGLPNYEINYSILEDSKYSDTPPPLEEVPIYNNDNTKIIAYFTGTPLQEIDDIINIGDRLSLEESTKSEDETI